MKRTDNHNYSISSDELSFEITSTELDFKENSNQLFFELTSTELDFIENSTTLYFNSTLIDETVPVYQVVLEFFDITGGVY